MFELVSTHFMAPRLLSGTWR